VAAVLARLRAEFHARWRAWLAVSLLIGVGGGAVLTTAAGARRTASAYTRFLRASHGADVLVSPDRTGFPHLYPALSREPGATVTPVIGFGASPVAAPKEGMLVDASTDGALGTTVERPKITAGRMLRANAAQEVVADTTAARDFHLRPGRVLRVRIARSQEELASVHDPLIDLHVVGVGVTRDNVVTVNALASAPTLLAGPAFARRFGARYYAFDGAEVQLAPGASKAAFSAAAQSIARRLPETGGNLSIADAAQQAAQVVHAIRPQAVALALFAALTALTALFALGQLLSRRLFLSSTDNHVLRALGLSRGQLFVSGLVATAVTAVVGALMAVAIAVATSPTMPIGPARVAEPHPGVAFDWPVLGLGFAAIVLLFVAIAAWPAWRLASRTDVTDAPARRPSAAVRWATNAGAPPNLAIGVGYAVDSGRGRGAVPARSAIVVTALAVLAITAATTFGTNLSRLVHTPRLYGQAWDLTADAQFSPLNAGRITSILRAEPGVAAWTFGTHTYLNIAGHIVPGVALVPDRNGMIAPTVVSGHAAGSAGEVALGSKTLSGLHQHVGQIVAASLPQPGTQTPPSERLQIVGRSVFPFFGEGSFTPTGLGVGAQIAEPAPRGHNGAPINFVLVRFAPGATHRDVDARVARALDRAHLCGIYNQCSVSPAIRPTDILNYSRILSTPIALAVVLALLAIAVVGNTLLTSIRRRRHELAILKSLGLGRRGISATVAWQASTLVGLALLVGLPLGVVLGLRVWSAFAAGLGITSDAQTPWLVLVLAVPAALLIANAIAAVPGYLAGRTPPAEVLRAE